MIHLLPPIHRSLVSGALSRLRGFGGTAATNPAAPVATTIGISPSSSAFALGGTQQYTATVRDQFGQVMSATVSWSSNSGSVSINSSTGLATANSYGSATITATSGALSNTATATVQQPASLAMITQPAGATTGSQFGTQPVVELRDGSGNTDGESGRTVTVSISAGSGLLSGTTSVTTDGSGRAVFTNLVITGTGPHTLTFASAGLTGVSSSSFTVNAAGSFLFRSDWSTATGTSAAARLDTGKAIPWSNNIGSGADGAFISVVPATGLGFPGSMTNVLQVLYNAPDDYEWIIANNRWSAPSGTGSLYFRIYLRHAGTNAGDGPWASAHPVESEGGTGGVAGDFYTFKLGNWADGTFPFAWVIDASNIYWSPGVSNDATHNSPGPLTKNTTYRIEWKVTRVDATHYKSDMRIYGSDDTTLLFTSSNIYVWFGGTMAADSTNSGAGYVLDDAHVADFRLGKNGGWGFSGSKVYWGGFAVSNTDWCGAYSASG